ncbi:MAG: alpha/beta fold hydrolase, partial [Rhodospirillaceae bacterium]
MKTFSTNTKAASSWFTLFRSKSVARLRLICLPYAGAGAAAWREWPAAVAVEDQLEVVAIRLPGRENRINEPCATEVAAVIPGMVTALRPLLDLPFVIFGHSLGAFIAHDLTHALADLGCLPNLLVISGAPPPHLPRKSSSVHNLPEKEFRECLCRLGGTPPEVLTCHSLMDLLAPVLRADFRMADTYRRHPAAPLPCPVLAFSGSNDPLAPPSTVAGWHALAGAGFTHRTLSGDHFFLHRHRAELIETILAHTAVPEHKPSMPIGLTHTPTRCCVLPV